MSWVAVAIGGSALIGGINGYMQGQDQEDQMNAQAQNNKDAANLTTQREIWLQQQQQRWMDQDKATDRAQKRADIGVFQNYQANPANYKPSANLWQQQADSDPGGNFDPTQLGALSQLAGSTDANPTPAAAAGGSVPGRGDNITWVT